MFFLDYVVCLNKEGEFHPINKAESASSIRDTTNDVIETGSDIMKRGCNVLHTVHVLKCTGSDYSQSGRTLSRHGKDFVHIMNNIIKLIADLTQTTNRPKIYRRTSSPSLPEILGFTSPLEDKTETALSDQIKFDITNTKAKLESAKPLLDQAVMELVESGRHLSTTCHNNHSQLMESDRFNTLGL